MPSQPAGEPPAAWGSLVPAPELPLDPLLEIWPRHRRFKRCHHARFGATEFNPGRGRGRFHPFSPASAGSVGEVPVPVLYGADGIEGALSESVFHDVPIRGRARAILRATLLPLVVTTLAAERDLTLVQLHGHGLGRLGVRRAELIEAEADRYPQTVVWAAALHACDPAVDGLVWVSRQFDTVAALVLFGDRVGRDDLSVVEPPLPLYLGPGFSEVLRSADLAGIAVLE